MNTKKRNLNWNWLILISLLIAPCVSLFSNIENTQQKAIFSYNELTPKVNSFNTKFNSIQNLNIVNDEIDVLKFKIQVQIQIQRFYEKIEHNPKFSTEIQEIVNLRENTLRIKAPHLLKEIQDLSISYQIPYKKMLTMSLFDELNTPNDDGCTSWVSSGSANKNNETLLHKNRDYDYDAQIVVRGNTSGKYKYTAVVTASNPTGVAAGINEYGLSIVNNMIATTDVEVSGIGNLHMNRLILEECKTVEEVSAFIDTQELNSGVIFLVADKNKGAIFEVKASARTTLEQSLVIDNVAYRANQFVILNGSGTEGSKTSLIRYNAAKAFLDARKGNLTILDSFELSRHHYLENNQPDSKFNRPDGSISNYHTLFGATFQIQKINTKELSTAWIAMNHPCSSVYIPVHFSSDEIPPYVATSRAYDDSKLLFENNLGPWAGVTPYFLNLEQEMMLEEEQMKNSLVPQLLGGNDSIVRMNLTNFDLEKANLMENEIEKFTLQKFWYDGFGSLEGIANRTNLIADKNGVQLSRTNNSPDSKYDLEGTLFSRNITSKNWENAVLKGDFTLPINTSLEIKILTSNLEVIVTISSDQLKSGYSLSNIAEKVIVLYAQLSTQNSSQTPVLKEWNIFGLEGDRDTGTYWENIPYYYWYGAIAIIGVIILCCCCCCYRKYKETH